MKLSIIKAVAIIAEFEGFMPNPYLCPAGVWTQGYGQVLKNKQGRMLTTKDRRPIRPTMSEVQAKKLLEKTVTRIFVPGVHSLINRYDLRPSQWAALYSFCFNLGTGNLRASTLRKVINRGDDEEAPDQFRRWNKAGGRVLAGLTRRREAEASLWQC